MKKQNDVIVTSCIKISKILKLKSKDNTRQALHSKFYASKVKTSELGGSEFSEFLKAQVREGEGCSETIFNRIKMVLDEWVRF